MNSPGNLFWGDKRIQYYSDCTRWKGRKYMLLIIECGVGYKVVSKTVCLTCILKRSKNFGSMKKRRNGGLDFYCSVTMLRELGLNNAYDGELLKHRLECTKVENGP